MNAPSTPRAPIPATLDIPLLGRSETGGPFGYKGAASLLTVAQAGSGKDRCVITPNLITYKGSIIVTDPKGQSVNETAAWRRVKLGQPVHVFDPFGVTDPVKLPAGCLASFNPIDLIRTSRTPVEDAKVIAAALVQAEERQPHFSNGARQLLSGILVFVALDPKVEDRTMGQVWRYMRLGSSGETNDAQGEAAVKDDHFRHFLRRVAQSKVQRGYAAGEANAFLRMNQKEAASFLSTLYTNCGSIFDSPAIIDNMASSSVDFGSLQRKPASIYLVLPGAFAETHARWFRLLLACAFMQVERAGLAPVAGQAGPVPTLFILNEFFTLGRFPQIVEAMGRMRGYGVKFWSFVQNLSQLKEHYGEGWTNIAGNAGIIQYFGGSGDYFTMDYLSKLSGLKTVGTTSINDPDKGPGSQNYSQMSRPVMYPDEVGRLEQGTQFVYRVGQQSGFGSMVYTDQDFPEHKRYLAGLVDIGYLCPNCGKQGVSVRPAANAYDVLASFPCCGEMVLPYIGPGWRSMLADEPREVGKLYRTTALVADGAGGHLWDVFDPSPDEAETDAAEEVDTAPLDPVETVRASAAPVEEAALEAALCVPFGDAEPKLTMLARWLISGLLVFVALEARWPGERDMAALRKRVGFDHDLFREFVEVVTLSDVADGFSGKVAKAYLAGDEEEAAAIHRLLHLTLNPPT